MGRTQGAQYTLAYQSSFWMLSCIELIRVLGILKFSVNFSGQPDLLVPF